MSEKKQVAKEHAKEAFDKVRPEVRNLAAASLVQGVRAGLTWLIARPGKASTPKQDTA